MGENDQCHREKKTSRPLLTLGGERDMWTGEPLAAIRLRERLGQKEAERCLASQQARDRAEERKRAAEERKRAAEGRVSRELHDAELRKEKWMELARQAAEIGLTPDPKWSESEFREELYYKRREFYHEELRRQQDEYRAAEKRRRTESELLWQRQEREKAVRFLAQVWEQSVVRNRKVKDPIDPEELGDSWEYIPHVAKFGDWDRGEKNRADRGDLASWNCAWISQCAKMKKRTQDRLRAEHKARSGEEKLGYYGKRAHNPQKQRRTWEAAAPRKWRRKDQCAERWNQLLNNHPAAE